MKSRSFQSAWSHTDGAFSLNTPPPAPLSSRKSTDSEGEKVELNGKKTGYLRYGDRVEINPLPTATITKTGYSKRSKTYFQ
jgi:hypothetical protein